MMKQRGGMLAKGRLLGLQFDTLFTDDLYFKISRHANVMAKKIHAIFEDCGYKFLFDSPTNQQYPIMSDAELAIWSKASAMNIGSVSMRLIPPFVLPPAGPPQKITYPPCVRL